MTATAPVQASHASGVAVSASLEGFSLHLGARALFEQFSLSVAPGERVILSGPSGCGKSTLLRCLCGLALGWTGRIRVADHELNPHTVWHIRSHIAYVPQEPAIAGSSAGDWLDGLFRLALNQAIRPSAGDVGAALGHFNLDQGILSKAPGVLSGGERQRLALAGALLLKRNLWLLDEPTSALDDANRLNVWRVLADVPGAAMIAVSHDLRGMEAFSSRVVPLGGTGEG